MNPAVSSSNTSGIETVTTASKANIGEAGTVHVNQQSDGQWHTVSLDKDYSNPVVVMGPVGPDGGAPAMTRVKDVGGGDFKFQIEEWTNNDGAHAAVDVSYAVVEEGRHTLADGRVVEAGKTATNDHWKTVSLGGGFDGTPTVISQAMTFNGGQPITTRNDHVSGSSFDVRVQEDEANGPHATETIGYLAFEQGNGDSGHVGNTGAKVDHNWTGEGFGMNVDDPALLATDQSFRGGDPGSLRFNNLDSNSTELRFQEGTAGDSETGHADVNAGVAALETGGLFAATGTPVDGV